MLLLFIGSIGCLVIGINGIYEAVKRVAVTGGFLPVMVLRFLLTASLMLILLGGYGMFQFVSWSLKLG